MREILYPPARAQGIGEVLESGLRIFRATAGATLGYATLAALAVALPNINDLANGRPLPTLELEDGTPRIAGADPVYWAWYVAGTMLALFLWSALLLRQRALASGQPARTAKELRSAAASLSGLIVSVALAGLAMVAGLSLFIVPGLYLSVVLVPAPLVVVLMRKGPVESLLYGATLVRGNWWRTSALSGAALGVCLLVIAVSIVLTGTVAALGRIGDVQSAQAIALVLDIVANGISTPLVSALMLAMLGDLVVRRGEAAGAARGP